MKGIHWFRADLRILDNPALHTAISECDVLYAIFILTPQTWQQHDMAPIQQDFLIRHLHTLSQELEKLGIPLLIRSTPHFSDCVSLLNNICQKYQIDTLYFNRQYEWDEQQRDRQIEKMGIRTKIYDDQCVLPPGSILTEKHEAYRVFTPFQRTWLKKMIAQEAWKPRKTYPKIKSCLQPPDPLPETNHLSKAWPVGNSAALHRLTEFCHRSLATYHQTRDFPAQSGTSRLSPYLTLGILSVRQCIGALFHTLPHQNWQDLDDCPGQKTWLMELIWREFYKHIMAHFPKICWHQPFKTDMRQIPWKTDPKLFQAWCTGHTGFPLVDAAMRQLNQTGFMHNRLRMVTAMFLSKTLFLDWRLGEQYFMRHLIDGDLAANNGGWQWSASTGTDSVPYFRIFNPITQSERFDPEGNFIRQYCPELAHLDNHTIHDPHTRNQDGKTLSYPTFIVDYKAMRTHVLAEFKKMTL